MESIWSKTVDMPERAPMQTDIAVEAAVIGGGLAGLLCAYYLQRQGKQVVVIEENRIGSGQTGNTTAKVTSQHGLRYASLLHNYGEGRAKLYAEANEEAIKEFAELIEEEKIECDFEWVNAYLYSMEDSETLKQEYRAAKKLGIKAHYMEHTPLPFSVKGAVCFEGQAQLHPLKLLKALSEGLTVYEQTKALRVRGNCIFTNRGTIRAEHIIFATHYPFPRLLGFYSLRQHQESSYVSSFTGIPKFDGIFYSADKQGLSYRWYGDALLAGGGGKRTGKAAGISPWEGIREKLEALFPGCKQTACWSAQDCMPHDGLLFAGAISLWHPNWYVATGFQKWGMTGAMVSAGIICDKICGVENKYAKLFTPQRCHLKAAWTKLWKDIGISGAELVKGHFYMPFKTVLPEPGQAKVIRLGLRRYGVYCDENGTFHKTAIKCSHLGCLLQWNSWEKTWDCPCHGSRFDVDGRLLENPAQKNV